MQESLSPYLFISLSLFLYIYISISISIHASITPKYTNDWEVVLLTHIRGQDTNRFRPLIYLVICYTFISILFNSSKIGFVTNPTTL